LLRRPVHKDEEERLAEMLRDTHDSFKAVVREARGKKIAGVNEEELFSGRVWTGRQAAHLGLTDGVAPLETKMRNKVGDNVSHPTPEHLLAYSSQAGSCYVVLYTNHWMTGIV
jgi:ClpP class serine protease